MKPDDLKLKRIQYFTKQNRLHNKKKVGDNS